jgi:acyl dehydratase
MTGPEVGDELPRFSRRTGLESWNRFAAVNDEFVPIHMDDAAGRRAGNPAGAFGMGNLRLSYLMNMLREWCGDEGDVVAIEVRYRGLNQKGDVLTTTGRVTAVDRREHALVVDVTLDVVDQRGRSTAPGTATVSFPVRE